MQRGVPLLLIATATVILAAGCGTSAHPAAAPRHAHAHHTKKSGQSSSPSSQGQSSGSTTPPASGNQAGSTHPASTGPTIVYSMMPPGAAAGPAANVGVQGLPSGWRLVSMALVGGSGLQVSSTVIHAMTGTFTAAQGGFSMGADGQVITFFFPHPPGSWAGQTVHFAFSFQTATDVPETVSSQSFTFPSK